MAQSFNLPAAAESSTVQLLRSGSIMSSASALTMPGCLATTMAVGQLVLQMYCRAVAVASRVSALFSSACGKIIMAALIFMGSAVFEVHRPQWLIQCMPVSERLQHRH